MILLDTHALVWWVTEPSRLPDRAARLLQSAREGGDTICVSSISIREIAMLVARNRLVLTVDVEVWLSRLEALSFLTFVPVDNRIATRSVHLDGFAQRDPADRIIVATAISMGATLVTADGVLRGYDRVQTVWD